MPGSVAKLKVFAVPLAPFPVATIVRSMALPVVASAGVAATL